MRISLLLNTGKIIMMLIDEHSDVLTCWQSEERRFSGAVIGTMVEIGMLRMFTRGSLFPGMTLVHVLVHIGLLVPWYIYQYILVHILVHIGLLVYWYKYWYINSWNGLGTYIQPSSQYWFLSPVSKVEISKSTDKLSDSFEVEIYETAETSESPKTDSTVGLTRFVGNEIKRMSKFD